MTRFFRKYSRTLILVFMSLLLIVFLVGDVVGRRNRGGGILDEKIGAAFGRDIRTPDVNQADRDIRLLSRLPFPMVRLLSSSGDGPLAYSLLLEEARHAGVLANRESAVQFMDSMSGGRAGDAMNQLMAQTGYSEDHILGAFSRFLAIFTYQGLMASSGLPSTVRLEGSYQRFVQTAKIKSVILDSRAFDGLVDEPTQEQIQAEFDAGRDRETAHTSTEIVNGYRLPDRVEIEYLTVDPRPLVVDIRVSEREAKKFYDAEKQRYARPDLDPATIQNMRDPTQMQANMIAPSYEEVRERVREDARLARAVKQAQTTMNHVAEAIRLAWKNPATDEAGFHVAPEGAPSFEELAQRFATEGVVLKKITLTGAADLRINERGFANAAPDGVEERLDAATLAFRVQGLYEPDPEKPDALKLGLNEPSPLMFSWLEGSSGNDTEAYIFRVTRAAPAEPAPSLEDIREEIVENLRRKAAYDMALDYAKQLRDAAGGEGLQSAVDQATGLKAIIEKADEPGAAEIESSTSGRYARLLTPLESSVRRASTNLPNLGVTDQITQVFDMKKGESRVVENARTQKVAVVESLGIDPLYRDPFESRLPEVMRDQFGQMAQVFTMEWFNPDNVKARTGFQPVNAAKK
ncbi:MAG: hypothetical protein KDA32_07805 [Phycisphaerales bacterium]|nr:hypothetical protein [Phycisphaerales bacterium]